MGPIACRLAITALLAGCGPSRIWVGKTPDRTQVVEVIEDAGLRYIAVDGKRRAAYRRIAGASVAFSARGHLAFTAQIGAQWVAVLDGVPGERWDSIGALVLSPSGRLAYAASRGGGWYAVVDERAGPRFDAIVPKSLRFSGDEHRVGYEARRGVDAYAVVDGVESPRWSAVGKLALSATGGRVGYAGLDREGWRVVIDGTPGATVDAVRYIAFRDDGAHAAWIARLGRRDTLFLDGAPVAAATAIRTSGIAFRPTTAPGDGPGLAHVEPVERSFAATIIRRGERVVVDGVPGATYDEVGAPIWSRDGRLAYAARRHQAWRLVMREPAGERELARQPRGREQELAGGDSVGEPMFSPDGRRLGYLVRRGAAMFAVVDGREHPFELAIEGSLAFSGDSRRWAVIAGDAKPEHLFFSIDGARQVPLPAAEVHAAVPSRGPASLLDLREADHRLLQAWSRAEAERAGP